MAPLVVEGVTLGQKHRNYNKILKEAEQKSVPEISYEEPDLENLLKLDVACKHRDVDYVIRVLQGEDMLYVSRAIKRSPWLVTDRQYANIINPTYLYDQLLPNIMTKAFNKLILHIRLNLKDEDRVEEFFNYYKERDLKAAFKWMPNCSIQCVEKVIKKHAEEIPNKLLKRLCEKSITYLDVYMHSNVSYYRRDALAATIFLLKQNLEKYLDIIETTDSFAVPRFGPKSTKLVMRKCSERVMSKLVKYSSIVHVPTFVKFIKPEDMQDFILTNIKKKEMRSWFAHNRLKPFVSRLPIESRFQFVKDVFIDKKHGDDVQDDVVPYYCSSSRQQSTSQNMYCWYVYAPFNTAFVDLKKLIRSESNPTERTAMFKVLLTSAGKDMKNIHTILKYYRERHINEPFKFKIQFVNLVISNVNIHKFDKETWGYLSDLFSSMDVYSESDKLDQNCVRAIIMYNAIHGESVPDIVEKKFLFDTFKIQQKDLAEEEKEKLFLYLYKYLTTKLDSERKTNDKIVLSKTLEVLKHMLNLLSDWNKNLQDFPTILNYIKEIIQINQKNKCDEDLSELYNFKKCWRKHFFAESIILSPNQEACINALKHGPEILESYKNEVESLCLNEKILVRRFLKKIRIYWSQTLANSYKDFFMSKVEEKNKQKAVLIGLCTLLQKNEISNLIQKYVPSESKIDWSQPNDVEVNLRKHLASSMHLARPQPSPTAVLSYAKGDYLQFALPSLNAILYNLSSVQTREHLTKLLNSPVSLQKHGIRTAFAKLKHDELNKLFSDIWKDTKNSSIRATIFNHTFDFLCKQTDPKTIEDIWKLLSTFMDNLTSEEDKSIYNKLSKVEHVPQSVRPEFWMKSYKFLKSLPPKANCDGLLRHLRNNMDDVMEFLDNDFVAELCFESFDENFSTKRYEYEYIVPVFLLSTRTEEAHIERYNKILVPIMERSFAMWHKTHEGTNYVRDNMKDLIIRLDEQFQNVVLQKKMILPISMFTEILKLIRENLSIEENYVFVTSRKLSLDCVKIIDKLLKTNDVLASTMLESNEDGSDFKYRQLYAETAKELGKVCVNHLREDVTNNFASIYILFAKAFDMLFEKFEFNIKDKMNALKAALEIKDFIPGYLFVLSVTPMYLYEDEEKALKSELLDEIKAHPSREVKMHCYDRLT